ncbi:type II toxin-antitoxin system RelE/ParE family toxin [Aliidiomarina maris]|uniref:Type II toxin-antitoxin system RelE/ParE family toxin n=1 Tax=Aliidiomarina maris TaxID=531312 RepID=A0ABY0BNA7_9GAMM|nr:type II toxin-antitoxin system RelE/ParE family toxin [Aliidiomarina maris]RUO18571.1 type II toxin-antitoxin system RelE/ParE family toxin [Aliidiomarina maris]
MKPVRFLGSAREDIRREKSYYRKINPDLAIQFQNALEIAVNAVSMQPFAMQILENEIRRWPLETFPHGVLYRNEERFVLILAVFHPKQAPERWLNLPRT